MFIYWQIIDTFQAYVDGLNLHLEAHAGELADGSLELIAYNQKVFEKQKGLARKVESVKDTQATDLNALSENNDRPVFDDMQRGVMAILVAFQTQSS
jgi:hypothetical protein